MTPQEEAHRLLEEGLHIANSFLEEGDGFYPFAMTLSLDDEIESVMGWAGEGENEEIIEFLHRAFRQPEEIVKYKAIGIFSTVLLSSSDGDGVEAVTASMEHRDGYCADIAVPYERTSDNEIQFGDLVAYSREGVLFRQ